MEGLLSPKMKNNFFFHPFTLLGYPQQGLLRLCLEIEPSRVWLWIVGEAEQVPKLIEGNGELVKSP